MQAEKRRKEGGDLVTVSEDYSIRLAKVMGRKGIRQCDLARMTKIPTSVISAYCMGKKAPRIERMCLIAECLGVPAEFFSAEFASKSFDPDEAYTIVCEMIQDNLDAWDNKQKISLVKLFSDDLIVYAISGRE